MSKSMTEMTPLRSSSANKDVEVQISNQEIISSSSSSSYSDHEGQEILDSVNMSQKPTSSAIVASTSGRFGVTTESIKKTESIASSSSSSVATTKTEAAAFELESKELPRNCQIALVLFGLIGGIMHLTWYNTILQIAPFIEASMDGYAPTSLWLPLGSIGSMIGNLVYFTKKDPVQVNHMVYGCLAVFIGALSCLIFILLAYYETISHSACTIVVGIFFFAAEFFRGYVQCLDFGFVVFFEQFGMNKTMSVAGSAGEGISGVIPWFVLLMVSFTNLDTPADNMGALCIAYGISLVVTLLYIAVLWNTFKRKKNELISKIFQQTKINRRNAELAKNNGEDLDAGFLSTWMKAIRGTRLVGTFIAIHMAGTLNLYPQMFPFGYPVTITQTQILLGIFTLLDPIFRVSGFSINKLLKGRIIKKWHYAAAVTTKCVVFWPLIIIPYYWPDNGFINEFWEYSIMMIALGIAQGSLIVIGVYCYMSHLPDTPYAELSASLVVVYFIIGVIFGQVTFLIYPLFKN